MTDTLLDEHLPSTPFHEHHRKWIDAPPRAVWTALSTLTLGDLTVTRPLLAVRHLGAANTRLDQHLVGSGPLTMFALRPPHYAVGGAISKPWLPKPPRIPVTDLDEFDAFDEPGWAKYLTDFAITKRGGGTLLQTTTRVVGTDARAARRFAAYWLLIRAGSGIVRTDMLRSVARHAEGLTSARTADVEHRRECPRMHRPDPPELDQRS